MTTESPPSGAQHLTVTGNTPRTEPENRAHFPALDGLRAIAMAMVFGQHYFGLPWGYTGVDLFFVLSGFLITGILFDSRHRPDRVRTFFVRRTLRIFPLYYSVLFFLFLVGVFSGVQWNRYWLVWPLYLGNLIRFVHPYSANPAYLQAANGWFHVGPHLGVELRLGHFWSLCLEEQFYLAWPWVVFWIKDRVRLTWLCAVVVLVMPLVRVLVMHLLPLRYTILELPYSFTPLRADALLLGGLLALLIRSRHRDLSLRVARWGTAITVPLVLFYLLATVHLNRPYQYHYWRLTWGQSLVDLFFVFILGSALVPGNLIYHLGDLAPLRWLGRISYGLYVFHDIPHQFYAKATERLAPHVPFFHHHARTGTGALALCGTVLLAYLSYRYLETPFLNLKERWAPSEPPRPARRTAQA